MCSHKVWRTHDGGRGVYTYISALRSLHPRVHNCTIERHTVSGRHDDGVRKSKTKSYGNIIICDIVFKSISH